MYILLVVIFIGLIASAVKARRNPALKPVVVGLALIAIVLASYSAYRQSRPRTFVLHPEWNEALGHGLGQLLAEDLPQGGAVLIIDYLPMGEFAESTKQIDESRRIKLSGLTKGWNSQAFQAVTPEPNTMREATGGMLDEFMIEFMLDAKAVAKIAEQHPDAVAIVSFLGVIPESPSETPVTLPPLYAVDYGTEDSPLYQKPHPATRGVVRTKTGTNFMDPPPKGASLADLFALRYAVVRPPYPVEPGF